MAKQKFSIFLFVLMLVNFSLLVILDMMCHVLFTRLWSTVTFVIAAAVNVATFLGLIVNGVLTNGFKDLTTVLDNIYIKTTILFVTVALWVFAAAVFYGIIEPAHATLLVKAVLKRSDGTDSEVRGTITAILHDKPLTQPTSPGQPARFEDTLESTNYLLKYNPYPEDVKRLRADSMTGSQALKIGQETRQTFPVEEIIYSFHVALTPQHAKLNIENLGKELMNGAFLQLRQGEYKYTLTAEHFQREKGAFNVPDDIIDAKLSFRLPPVRHKATFIVRSNFTTGDFVETVVNVFREGKLQISVKSGETVTLNEGEYTVQAAATLQRGDLRFQCGGTRTIWVMSTCSFDITVECK